MKLPSSFLVTSLLASAFFLTSCGSPDTPNPRQKAPLKAAHINPFKPGTHLHFRHKKSYPRNYGVWKNEEVLTRTNASNSSIVIDLSAQRGYMMNGDELAMDYPISSGTSKFPTPTGKYKILETIKKNKKSNTYGKIYDSSEKIINRHADFKTDKVPEGGKFVGAPMPYWMRLTWDGIGMHKGRVPRRPASHGCIRTYYKVVPLVFSKVKLGTPVSIVE